MDAVELLPKRRILAITTVGGSTNSAPILEVCQVLAQRGHQIEFATLKGRENLVKSYPFVSKVHIIGRAITAEEDEELYIKLSRWSTDSVSARSEYWSCKKFYDSFWTETYHGLTRLMEESRFDYIFSDFQMESPKDVAKQFSIPLAEMWPQMPWLMAPQPWIPGMVGAQLRCLTNEHASMYDRVFEQTHLLRDAPNLIDYYLWVRRMRRRAGVMTMPSTKPKPDHVVLINSFIGSEVPKDLPPLMMVAGPILSDEWQPLDDTHLQFLKGKKRVLYFACGTHVILAPTVLDKILHGLADAMREGSLDGVLWAVRNVARKQFADLLSTRIYNDRTVSELLDNRDPSWLFVDHAPQRAVLDHDAVKLFFTHVGPSSANETLYHGVAQICMGIYGDQLPRVMRMEAAGVSLTIDKHHFSARELADKVRTIIEDRTGDFARNVLRMKRIAHVASRKKHAAADLIEEHMYDWELRFERLPASKEASSSSLNRGQERSPMHLQTADMRMPWWKASNFDQKVIAATVVLLVTMVYKTVAVRYWS